MKKFFILLAILPMLSACGSSDNSLSSTTAPAPQVSTVTSPTTVANIQCQVYDLTGKNFNSLPDFDTLSYAGYVNVDQFDSYVTNNQKPFQKFVGTQFESMVTNFGLRCEAKINAPMAGSYLFALNSDDGSALYVDGALVVNNDGSHAMTRKAANVNLGAGLHSIKVNYFQGMGDKGLILTWQVPGGVETIVDDDSFSK